MSKKDLLKRIESIESYLGLVHTVNSDGYHEHVAGEYGFMRRYLETQKDKK